MSNVLHPHPRHGMTRRHSLTLAAAALLTECQRSGQPFGQRAELGRNISDPVARRFYSLRGWRAAWDRNSAQSLSHAVAGAGAHGLAPGAFAPKPLPGH